MANEVEIEPTTEVAMRLSVVLFFVLVSGCLAADGLGDGGAVPDYLICKGCVFRQVFAPGNYARSGWACVDYAPGLTRPMIGTGADFAQGTTTPLHPLNPLPTVPILPPRPGDLRDCREIPPGLYVDISVDLQLSPVRAVAVELTNAPGSTFVWCAGPNPDDECLLWDVAIAKGKVACGYNDGRPLLSSNECVGWFPRVNWVLVDATSPGPNATAALFLSSHEAE